MIDFYLNVYSLYKFSHYLFYSIKSKFRKGPWPKKINMEHIDMIKRKYGYSQKRAEEALELLNDEQQ